MEEKYEQVKGYVGYEDNEGNVFIVSGYEAISFAKKYEPFPVYKKIT